MEEWRKIEGFEQYEVSSEGRVRRFNKIKLPGMSDGYYQVKLCKDGMGVSKKIHRLVGEAFIPKIEGKDTLDHINRDKLDNRVSNLRWATRSEQNINSSYTPSNTGMRNIYKNTCNTYVVMLRRNKLLITNKTFKTLEEAIEYRDSLI